MDLVKLASAGKLDKNRAETVGKRVRNRNLLHRAIPATVGGLVGQSIGTNIGSPAGGAVGGIGGSIAGALAGSYAGNIAGSKLGRRAHALRFDKLAPRLHNEQLAREGASSRLTDEEIAGMSKRYMGSTPGFVAQEDAAGRIRKQASTYDTLDGMVKLASANMTPEEKGLAADKALRKRKVLGALGGGAIGAGLGSAVPIPGAKLGAAVGLGTLGGMIGSPVAGYHSAPGVYKSTGLKKRSPEQIKRDYRRYGRGSLGAAVEIDSRGR